MEGFKRRKKNFPSFSPASVSQRSDLTHRMVSPLTLQQHISLQLPCYIAVVFEILLNRPAVNVLIDLSATVLDVALMV